MKNRDLITTIFLENVTNSRTGYTTMNDAFQLIEQLGTVYQISETVLLPYNNISL